MLTRISCLLLCFLICLTASAQSSKKDLELSIEALNKAMLSQDKSVLENLTADELTYGHSTGAIENKSEFVKNILTGPTKFSSIDFTDQRMEITDNIAIVRDIAAYKGSNNNSPLDVKIGLLMIWRKQGANWKLLARQGYKLP